ncbi:MAG: methyl-accepting chemotaxis protein [Spirochaetaceae bacterium]|jgi:methyl-accepting chemotaxis protein|nr:methyl-accepting chemotaxis protein [Spirochaetaceae bacterium]
MTIEKRIVILNGLVVLVVSLSLGILAVSIATGVVRRDAEASMLNQSVIAANLVAETIRARIDVLQGLADRDAVRSMDFETQRESLINEIDRTGVDDFAIVHPDGIASHLKGGQTPDLSTREYVQRGLRGEKAVSDIIASSTGMIVTPYPVINYMVPITVDGTPVGGLLARNDATRFSDIVKAVGNLNGGLAYLINLKGIIIAHPDKDLVMKSFSAQEAAKTDSRYTTSAEAIAVILSQKRGSMLHDIEGQNMLIGFCPVPGFDMILVSMVEERATLHELYMMRNLMFIGVGVFMLLGILAALLIARSIAKPILSMFHTFEYISQGDLTKRIDIRSKDEIGSMARHFNLTIENVSTMMFSIKDQSSSLQKIGMELSAIMTETAKAINQIAATIHIISDQTNTQNDNIADTNETVEQIIENLYHLNKQLEDQSVKVVKSSAAIEEMLTNIQSITETLVKNADNVKALTEASEMGRSGLQTVVSDIQDIARESEGLLEINAVMENIASQTNLLSMNAAIEAAHAGEAGKGFAVVASEIRKLAENSSQQSKTIGTVLKKIKESIDKITLSTHNVLNRFEAVDRGVKSVSEEEAKIRSAMEEQGAGNKHILELVSEMNDSALQVKSESELMLLGCQEVIEKSQNLERVTKDITKSMNEMAAGAEQITVTVKRVNAISQETKEDIQVLVNEVSKFKVAP